MTKEEVFYVQICTECNIRKEPTTGEPDGNRIKNGETNVTEEKPMERQAKGGKIPNLEERTV